MSDPDPCPMQEVVTRRGGGRGPKAARQPARLSDVESPEVLRCFEPVGDDELGRGTTA